MKQWLVARVCSSRRYRQIDIEKPLVRDVIERSSKQVNGNMFNDHSEDAIGRPVRALPLLALRRALLTHWCVWLLLGSLASTLVSGCASSWRETHTHDASHSLELVASLEKENTRIVLDVMRGSAEATSRGKHGQFTILEAQATGDDLTAAERTDVFDAFVASAYGLDLHAQSTVATVHALYARNAGLTELRTRFIHAGSGELVDIELPSPAQY